MAVLRNSYGVSVAFNPKVSERNFHGRFAGSSLERRRDRRSTMLENDAVGRRLRLRLSFDDDNDGYKLRSLSNRTKTKIRKKVIAVSRIHRRLTFVTLTFLNQVDDRQAIKVLGAFLDYVSKQHKSFEYLWVVEKQAKNSVFRDNVHFHLITTIYWGIHRWWNYWVDLQKKNGILPRKSDFKPSSAFDVKRIKANDVKNIGNYIRKYITKSTCEFHGSLWNCSKGISRLYTDFYSDMEFLDQFYRLQDRGLLKGKIKAYEQEHFVVYLLPLDKPIMHLYNSIDIKNRAVWGSEVINN